MGVPAAEALPAEATEQTTQDDTTKVPAEAQPAAATKQTSKDDTTKAQAPTAQTPVVQQHIVGTSSQAPPAPAANATTDGDRWRKDKYGNPLNSGALYAKFYRSCRGPNPSGLYGGLHVYHVCYVLVFSLQERTPRQRFRRPWLQQRGAAGLNLYSHLSVKKLPLPCQFSSLLRSEQKPPNA